MRIVVAGAVATSESAYRAERARRGQARVEYYAAKRRRRLEFSVATLEHGNAVDPTFAVYSYMTPTLTSLAGTRASTVPLVLAVWVWG